MISPIFNQDVFKVISLFGLSPGYRFNRKDIKEKTKLNNVPLDNALVKLQASNVLIRKNNYYSFNLDNSSAKLSLDIASRSYKYLKEIPFDVYLLLIDLINYTSKIKNVEVYLFGSYSKLIYKDNSDVDIAFLGNIDKKSLNKFVSKTEKIYNKDMEIHYFDRKLFYKNKKDPLVKDIIKNGVRLI